MIAGIVLAAGESRRMGATKQLLDAGGETMLARVVGAALASRLDWLAVVVGHEADAVMASLAGRAVVFVRNPSYAEGLGSSVRAGVAALPAEAEAAMFLLADQPGISVDLIDQLLDASTPRNIVAPSFQGQRSNPTVFGRRWFEDLAWCEGDSGGRAIIAAHPDALAIVETSADLRDVDTPEDHAALLERLSSS